MTLGFSSDLAPNTKLAKLTQFLTPPLSLPSENYHLTQHLSRFSHHWAVRVRGQPGELGYSSGSHRGMIQATNQGFFFPLGQSPLDFFHQEPLHQSGILSFSPYFLTSLTLTSHSFSFLSSGPSSLFSCTFRRHRGP